jgi:hypothetical protein
MLTRVRKRPYSSEQTQQSRLFYKIKFNNSAPAFGNGYTSDIELDSCMFFTRLYNFQVKEADVFEVTA